MYSNATPNELIPELPGLSDTFAIYGESRTPLRHEIPSTAKNIIISRCVIKIIYNMGNVSF